MIRPVEWRNGAVVLLDQRLLPLQEVYRVYRDHREVARAIKDMVVRGAPAIGVAAAMGIALGMSQTSDSDLARALRSHLPALRGDAADRGESLLGHRAHAPRLRARARAQRRGRARDPAPGSARDLPRGHRQQPRPGQVRRRAAASARTTVLTHCNAGALATAGYGTALGVIRAAHEARQADLRHRHRDAPVPAGRAPHRLGAQEGPHPGDADHRQHGRALHEARRDRRGDRRRRPDGRQRRRRQQDRHLHRRGARGAPPHPVLRRRADLDDRPRLPERRRDPHRGAHRAAR